MNPKYEEGKILFQQGMSITKVCKELGMSRKWFTDYLRNQNIETNPSPFKISFNRDYFKEVNTEEKMYWLGFLFADGCIVENKKNGKAKGMVLELAVANEDKEHLYKFCDAVKADYSTIKKKIVKLNGKEFVCQRITLCSTDMCKDLIMHGMTPRKSFSVCIPDDVMNSPFLKDFLRGYFDGNGHILKDRNGIAITSASPKILIQFKVIFANLGCDDVKIVTDKAPAFEIRYFNIKDDKIILNYLYGNPQIYLTRKYETYTCRKWHK
ncbi:MAG: hypothetical protein N2645_16215 [Clostridia bacterium]|nr:hypothetical protein [Clostridia bacterium]